MSDSSADFYHQKTDDQLRFFVEHPELYQSELIAAAERELRRRNPSAQTSQSAAVVEYVPISREAPARGGAKAVALGLVVLALGGGTYWLKQRNDAAVVAVRARAEARKRQPPPRLVEVATSALPNYDVAAVVARQLRAVPAAEQADAPRLRQFRELAKRFWTAETQTEYLTTQVFAGKAGSMFSEQALVAREAWRAWNQAKMYGYQFGPVMTDHVDRMSKVASSQQHLLADLPALLPNRLYLTHKETLSREADVQDLLKGVLPVSPVTGRPYKATVITINY